MELVHRVRVGLSLAMVASLAALGAPSVASAQVCGPGPHWVDACATGVDHFLSGGTMTVDLTGFGTFTFDTREVVRVWRGNAVDQYIHPFEGPIGLLDGHSDVLPTELNFRGMTTQLLAGVPVLIRAGDGIANGIADNSRFSPGAIDEYPATLPQCPAPAAVPLNEQACSFFDVFFEISHPLFGTLHNVDPALAVADEPLCSIDIIPYNCPPPTFPPQPLGYHKAGSGFVLVDASGQPRGQLVIFQHVPIITPEPASVGLLASGLAGLAAVALRRRRDV